MTRKTIAFSLGIAILLLSGLAILTNHQGFALRLINYSFWVFFLGLVLYFWELINAKR